MLYGMKCKNAEYSNIFKFRPLRLNLQIENQFSWNRDKFGKIVNYLRSFSVKNRVAQKSHLIL